jgi:replicative DNA helicase
MIDRLPPHNIDAETAVLGSILIDRDAIVEIAGMLKPDDFYRPAHGRIYQAMLYLSDHKSQIDIVTVAEELERNGDLESIGGASYLSMLGNDTPTAVHVVQYATIVQRKAVLRNMIQAAGKIAAIGYEDGANLEDALDRADVELKRVQATLPQTVKQPDPANIIARMKNVQLKSIPTRWPGLNNFTMGYMPGQFWVVGGFTSTGKSAFAVNAVADVIKAGGTVMIASTEMTQEQYMLRLISLTSGVPQRVIRRGGMTTEQYAAFSLAVDYWKDQKLRIYDDLYNLQRIRRMARKTREQLGGLDLLVVDFMQNINESGEEVKEMTKNALTLQAYAKELDCTVLGLSQVSNAQAMAQNESGVGTYYAFKGSGAIAHAADVAIMLDRNNKTDPTTLWMHVVKNRHDEMGTIACRLDLPTGGISQMTEQEALMADPNSGRRSAHKQKDD